MIAAIVQWHLGTDGDEPTRRRETPAERENRMRRTIAKACRRMDRLNGVDFGTHQKALIRETNKSIINMTPVELDAVIKDVLPRLYVPVQGDVA